MVDSGASSNVMPLSVCKKLNATWENCPIQIVQLDRSKVKVVGRLRNFLLILFADPQIHQTIDIVIADIPETYGMWLSQDWLEKLKGLLIGLTCGCLLTRSQISSKLTENLS